MKFLDLASLESINSVVSSVDVGDRVVNGRVEAYAFKPYKEDKKLMREMNQQYPKKSKHYFSQIGSLKLPSTRKLMAQLISTLNSSFPDYCFSEAEPSQFRRIKKCSTAINTINLQVVDPVCKVNPGFKTMFWSNIDEIIDLASCDVYRFVPDLDSDVFSIGKLFSLNFFFVNRRRRKLLFFTCAAVSKLHAGEPPDHSLAAIMDMEESNQVEPIDECCGSLDVGDSDASNSWMGAVSLISVDGDEE